MQKSNALDGERRAYETHEISQQGTEQEYHVACKRHSRREGSYCDLAPVQHKFFLWGSVHIISNHPVKHGSVRIPYGAHELQMRDAWWLGNHTLSSKLRIALPTTSSGKFRMLLQYCSNPSSQYRINMPTTSLIAQNQQQSCKANKAPPVSSLWPHGRPHGPHTEVAIECGFRE